MIVRCLPSVICTVLLMTPPSLAMATLRAQEPTPGDAGAPAATGRVARVDAQQVARQIAQILERPAGTPIDTKKAVPELDALLARYEGADLGAMGYVRGLREYLARDYAAAGVALDRFFTRHAPADVADREHASMLGRIYMNSFSQEARRGEPDFAKLQRWAERALQLTDDATRVARLVGTLLPEANVAGAAGVRTAVASRVLAGDGDAATKDAALKTLYGGPAPAAPRAPGTRGATEAGAAAAQPSAPPTLKPFEAKAMSGKTIKLEDYRGKVVLVDFWATWCPPCMREMPNVVAAYEKYADRGFEVIGISLDHPDAEQKIRDVEERLGMKWEQIYDGGGWKARLATANGIQAIPRAFLVDRAGQVRYTGRDTKGDRLGERIEELLAEK